KANLVIVWALYKRFAISRNANRLHIYCLYLSHMRKLLIFLLVLPFFCCDLVASPDFKEYTGKVTRIIDGDTFEVLLEGNRTEKIRLNAIDCPERGQDFYAVARKGLSELIFQK